MRNLELRYSGSVYPLIKISFVMWFEMLKVSLNKRWINNYYERAEFTVKWHTGLSSEALETQSLKPYASLPLFIQYITLAFYIYTASIVTCKITVL